MENTFLPGLLMAVLSLLCFAVVLAELRRALVLADYPAASLNRTVTLAAIGIFGWLILLGVLSIIGFFRDFSLPPRLLLFVIAGFFISLMITFSKGYTNLAKSIPPHWLVLFQSFRILVEILLWIAFTRGLLPEQMTFEGYNYDIFSGILALPVGWAIATRKPYARVLGIAYNIIGLLLLFNIITIAVLSMPTPFRMFMNEPSNSIVAEFPFVYLPGVLVVLAFAFHMFSLRQLMKGFVFAKRLAV